MKKRNLSLWAVLFWLLVWQAGSMALHSDILLVSPLRVLQTLLALIQTTRFWSSLLGSMGRILGGFLLAAALGTLLAALAARFKRVEELLAPLVLAMKTVPVASFIILALIWFGSRSLSVFIALVMVFPVMYTNVFSGHPRAGRQPAGNGAGIQNSGASAHSLHRSAAGHAVFPRGLHAGAWPVLESGRGGGGHRHARALHRRALAAGEGLP